MLVEESCCRHPVLPHSVIDNDLTDIYLNQNLGDYVFKLLISSYHLSCMHLGPYLHSLNCNSMKWPQTWTQQMKTRKVEEAFQVISCLVSLCIDCLQCKEAALSLALNEFSIHTGLPKQLPVSAEELTIALASPLCASLKSAPWLIASSLLASTMLTISLPCSRLGLGCEPATSLSWTD